MLTGIHLFLQSIEVVYDDSNEQIQGEERATDNKDDKVQVVI